MTVNRHIAAAPLFAVFAVTTLGVARSAAAAPTAIDVDVHYAHACATTSCGDALCWGSNTNGQAKSQLLPRNQLFPPPAHVEITTGLLHTCSIRSDRAVTCWGDDSAGQLVAPARFSKPLDWSFVRTADIDAGWFHTCATGSDGEIECWGDNSEGQSSPPPSPVDDYYAWIDVSAGAWHSCGLTPHGLVLCWGDDSDDQCYGHEVLDESWLLPWEEFVDVEVGDRHSCALTNQGHIYCWGNNDAGQLYDAEVEFDWAEIVPGFYRSSMAEFDRLVVSAEGTCGFSGTRARCWGSPFSGSSSYDPPAVAPVDAAFVGNFGCEIDGAGALSCWGVGPAAPSLGASCNPVPKPKFPW